MGSSFLSVSVIPTAIDQPGDLLPSEERIAKEMGVSRSSVREAITALRIQGILETRHGEGSVVRDVENLSERLSGSLVILRKETLNPFDIFIVRECIEPALVGLAVENAEEEQIRTMERHLSSMRKAARAENLDECFSNNARLHYSIMEATNNDVAIAMVGSLYQFMKTAYEEDRLWRKVINEYHCSEQNCKRCLSDHEAILKAIRERDVNLSRKWYVQHFAHMHSELFVREVVSAKKEMLGK